MLTLAISNSNYHYVDPITNREKCSFATDEPFCEIGRLFGMRPMAMGTPRGASHISINSCKSRGRCNSLAIYSLERDTSGVLWFLFVPVA